MKTIVPVLIGVTLALASAAGLAQETAKDELKVSIERKSLRDALNDWAQQTGNQLIAEIKGEFVAPKIEGKLTADQALERLLEGTPLTYEWIGERLVAVKEKGRVLPAAPQSTSADGKDQAPIRVARLSGNELGRVELAANEQSTRQNDQGSRIERRTRDVGSDTKPLEEIVVTAQKREQRLIDVPQSVSVLSEDTLSKLDATQFRDFANTVPGLTFTTVGAGNNQVSLRGVTTGVDNNPTVGIYVDEVPYGSSTGFALGGRLALDVGLFDVERIEVLRGPQGTLYGASTMGGLLKYVSRQPDFDNLGIDVKTGVSATREGGMSYNGAVAVNVPLATDTAALRASGFYSRNGGHIDNLALGRKDVDRSDIYGGRIGLFFKPSDALTINIGGYSQYITRDGQATADYTLAGDAIDGPLEQQRAFAEPFDQRFHLVSGTAIYDFETVTLTSISSYQTGSAEISYDISRQFVPILTGVGRSYSVVGLPAEFTTDKFAQEIRLASEGTQALQWVIGSFYTDEKSVYEEEFVLSDLAGQRAPNDIYTLRSPTRYEEYSAFGNVTYGITAKFDVSGGLRFARNRQTFSQDGTGLFGATIPMRRSTEDVTTYLANARYRFTDRMTGYLRYATGYRPGGPNYGGIDLSTGLPREPQTFEADRLQSYEAGFKAATADQRFSIDLAAFYLDWTDIQLLTTRNGFGIIVNAPDGANIQGGELTLSVRPTSTFTAMGAFAYQDARLAEAVPEVPALRGRKNERLPNVPRFTAALIVDWEIPVGTLAPTIGATLRHVTDRRAGFAASAFPYRLPEYTTVDLRTGITLGAVDMQLYIHNVFNEEGQLSAFRRVPVAQVAVLQPRTVGLSVTTRF